MRKLTHQQLPQEVKASHGSKVKILGAYVDSRTQVLVQCTKCDRKWRANTYDLRKGFGCAYCNGALKKTRAEYVAELTANHEGRVKLVGPYTHTNNKHTFKCECGNEFQKIAYDMLVAGHPCKLCWDKVHMNPNLAQYRLFRGKCYKASAVSYEAYRKIINPKKLVRSKDVHLDHKYSVYEAFANPKGLKNPITVEEVSHPVNLRVISQRENCIKHKNSIISASELRRRIAEFERNKNA